MWWILPSRVDSWDKMGKSWPTRVVESDPSWADGRVVGYMHG
jgi:hypothetical protein